MQWTALTLLTFFSSLVMAGIPPSSPPDLLALYQSALQYDPDLQAARERHAAGLEALPKARAGLLPSVSLSAEQSKVRSRSEGLSGVARAQGDGFKLKTYQATLSQPLFRPENWFEYRQGAAQAALANAEFADALQDFHLEVIEAYFETLRAQTQLETVRAEQTAVLRQLQQVRRRLEAGIASLLDVQETLAEKKRIGVALIRAQAEVERAFYTLEGLTGRALSQVRVLDVKKVPLDEKLMPLENWIARAKSRNPKLLAAQLSKRVAKHQASAAKAAHLPTLDLNLSYQREVSGESANLGFRRTRDLESDVFSVSLQLNMLLFSGGRVSANGREAAHLFAQGRERYRAVVEKTTTGVRVQYRNIINQRRAVEATGEAIEAQEIALKATRKSYVAGLRDIVDVVRAQRELFAARQFRNDAFFDLIIELARLHELAGTLNAAMIRKIDGWMVTS